LKAVLRNPSGWVLSPSPDSFKLKNQRSNKTIKPSDPEKTQPEEASNSLQGWPGYRTRAGRSGLDPVDNDAESGHMAGVLLRRLLTGKLRTRNPFTLLLLALLGLACIAPLLLAILEAFHANLLPFGAWVLITSSFILGIALLVNLVKIYCVSWKNNPSDADREAGGRK
jgi:hypothetical protein